MKIKFVAFSVAGLILAGIGGAQIEKGRAAHEQLMATDDAGNAWHVCATKPRQYDTPHGRTLEVDHYLLQTPCPAEPIE